MAPDPVVGGQLSTSPTSSGRSTPVNLPPRRPAEDALHKKDKNYRRYASGVERALTTFDSAQQEWADYIAFLARLLKAIQQRPPELKVIPHSATLATRLAQCLNPNLPSGVHQKALEVYSYIFSSISPESLSRDLHLYLPGLSPILSFAALSVRPAYLSLVESHLIDLDTRALRPALKAIILSLLPGLEEEASEDFERVLKILERIQAVLSDEDEKDEEDLGQAQSAGHSYFWQCLFLASISSPSRRQGALAFLMRKLPKFGQNLSPDAQAAVSPEPGLLIRCFATGLADEELLIQRGFLDLLVTNLPLHSATLQKSSNPADLDKLITAAAGVVSRRDMSLNRRLWAWFLGPDPKSSSENDDQSDKTPIEEKESFTDETTHHAAYFSRYGSGALGRSILRLLRRKRLSSTEHARPFRLCSSLMDRWEVGGLLVPHIFIPAIESVFDYSHSASAEQTDEVIRSASVFFDGVESGLIWTKIIELSNAALGPGQTAIERRLRCLEIVKFIVNRFNIRDEEMVTLHIPLALATYLVRLQSCFGLKDVKFSSEPALLQSAFDIIEKLVQSVPERTFNASTTNGGPAANEAKNLTASASNTLEIIQDFYTDERWSAEDMKSPLPPQTLGNVLIEQATSLFTKILLCTAAHQYLDRSGRLLCNLLQRIPVGVDLKNYGLLGAFEASLKPKRHEDLGNTIPFPALASMTNILAALQHPETPSRHLSKKKLSELTHALVNAIWVHLSPMSPKFHVEAVRCLWQLDSITSADRVVEASIAALVVHDVDTIDSAEVELSAEPARRFATIWTHSMQERGSSAEKGRGSLRRMSSMTAIHTISTTSADQKSILIRPLLLLLDSLFTENTELFAYLKAWLQDLPSLAKVFEIFTSELASISTLRSATTNQSGLGIQVRSSERKKDVQSVVYYLKHVSNILRYASDQTWMTLAGESVPSFGENAGGTEVVIQNFLAQACMHALEVSPAAISKSQARLLPGLHQTSLTILQQLLRSPYAAPLKELEIEVPLMRKLRTNLDNLDGLLQSSILTIILSALRLRQSTPQPATAVHDRRLSFGSPFPTTPRLSSGGEQPHKEALLMSSAPSPPPELIECLRTAFSSTSSRLVLDSWVNFLGEVLPFFSETIFQNLLPLVECLCSQLAKIFTELQTTFKTSKSQGQTPPEQSVINLINALEQLLARAHDRLLQEEVKSSAVKSPEQPQGFFGNMVSGVFASETPQSRSTTANNRLTVLLCFQDAVRMGFRIWLWGALGNRTDDQDHNSLGSYTYASQRLRNRSRRLLEHLFYAEALECLETLAMMWSRSSDNDSAAVISLLNVLNGSKPKHTIPAIFNAVYSRTNPNALDPARMSSLTSDVSETDLVLFLVEYTRSLEDDAMDEIWSDCIAFLKDVLANPMPHRQILPSLLDFIGILAEKVDNTNFGEQRKMRKELGDLFNRLLTATFTTRPMGFLNEPAQPLSPTKNQGARNGSLQTRPARIIDTVAILTSIIPRLQLILVEADRVAAAAGMISVNVINPSIRAKAYPDNISTGMLSLIDQLTRLPSTAKSWKKDVSDAFNEAKFFNFQAAVVKSHWLGILEQWNVQEKDRLPELLSRLTAPTTAGIMFGVGATSARQEADRKTQLNLRRIATLVLAAPDDMFVPYLGAIEEKIVELLSATAASSPSSATRAELFLLLRVLILKISGLHLAPLWPIINAELQAVLTSILPDSSSHEKYNNASVLQACKLLDTLVVLQPDDFQLHEWLFVTDTIDAVYKPPDWTPVALVDEIAEGLGALGQYAESTPISSQQQSQALQQQQHSPDTEKGVLRSSFLDPLVADLERLNVDVKMISKQDLTARVLRPFLGQLSMLAFESVYALAEPDEERVVDGLLRDLFDEGSS